MGVSVGRTATEPPQSQPTTVSRGSDRPELARFAVGDLVWRDDNRSGIQDPSESGASGISVQLLNADGEVVTSTVSGPSGHYLFDNLAAGTYSVRFAGIPADFRLTPTDVGDQRAVDSDPDYSGATPPFTLGVGEPNVRPATAADEVAAAYINTTIDAGITPLRYAVGDRVWFDLNSDGIQQPDEPAGSATVSLLTEAGNVVATATTDATGHYEFSICALGAIDCSSRVCRPIARSRRGMPGMTPRSTPTLTPLTDGRWFSTWPREHPTWSLSRALMPALPISRIRL
jgi:hypothetical protein